MFRLSTIIVVGLALVFSIELSSAQTAGEPISAKGRSLQQFLQSFDVEHRWLAGSHINWETGEPDDPTETLPGRHTHCSAFVAAVAKRLGIYVLRPPEHGQVLLANAQNDWLADEGARDGWIPVDGPVEAQTLANRGYLVVAGYRSRDDHRPGHIAIVLPADKGAALLEDEGPDVVQASTINSASISLRSGFSHHPHAWTDRAVKFYAHETGG